LQEWFTSLNFIFCRISVFWWSTFQNIADKYVIARKFNSTNNISQQLAASTYKRYAQTSRAYQDQELVDLLFEAGLNGAVLTPPITGVDERYEFSIVVVQK
jgi:hypothetical protein